MNSKRRRNGWRTFRAFLFARRRAWFKASCSPKKTKRNSKPDTPVDPNVKEVEEQLQRALGLKVRIEDKNGRGRVIIEYADLADFDGLLEQLAAG